MLVAKLPAGQPAQQKGADRFHLLDLDSSTVHLRFVHGLNGVVCLVLSRKGDETETLQRRLGLKRSIAVQKGADPGATGISVTEDDSLDGERMSKCMRYCRQTAYVDDLSERRKGLLEGLLIASP